MRLSIEVPHYTFTKKIPKLYENTAGIYFVVNKDDEVIYIGQSRNLYERANKYWSKPECVKIAIIPIDKDFLYKFETSAIWQFKPKNNRNHQHGKKHVSYWA